MSVGVLRSSSPATHPSQPEAVGIYCSLCQTNTTCPVHALYLEPAPREAMKAKCSFCLGSGELGSCTIHSFMPL